MPSSKDPDLVLGATACSNPSPYAAQRATPSEDHEDLSMVDACADLNWDSEREKQKQKELESTAVKQPMYTTEKPSSAAASPAQGSQQPDHSVVIDLDSEAITQAALKFADTAARNGFVRKVFGIVSFQLLVTVGIICMCMFVPPVRDYLQSTMWLFWLSPGLMIAVWSVIVVSDKARQVWPYNMLLLGALTVVLGFMVGTVSTIYSVQFVLLAMAVTSVIVIGITIFAFNTNFDATAWGTMLPVLVLTFITLLVAGIVWHSKWWQLLLAGLGALLFSACLLHDIQLLMGGKHKRYSISPDEYIIAAIILYLDILNIFLWVLGSGGGGGGGS